jgi:hypothetical protein
MVNRLGDPAGMPTRESFFFPYLPLTVQKLEGITATGSRERKARRLARSNGGKRSRGAQQNVLRSTC